MKKNKIYVAIAGVGNCACSFVQVIASAKDGMMNQKIVPGLIHPALGGYTLEDIEVVAAFDVNAEKVGKDLSEAIFTEPNCTTRYVSVPFQNLTVLKSPVLDGIDPLLADRIPVSKEQKPVNVAEELKRAKAQVLINLLPVGSTEAVEHFVQSAYDARVAFVNCMPEKIANSAQWHEKFKSAQLPLLGDDMKSQVGATYLHRVILEACRQKGAKILNSYQLNFGGNTDFQNMQSLDRKMKKKHTKTDAIESLNLEGTQISVGPSDFVPFLNDNKVAYIRLEGELLMGMKFNIETRLSVEDSPNAAGVIIDAIRAAKIALDRGLGGAIPDVSAFLFKLPPKKMSDEEADRSFKDFCNIKQDSVSMV
jgi:myo-inositol-1-phosphate synthase